MTESESKPKRRRWWLIALGSIALLLVVAIGGMFVVGSQLGEEVASSVTATFDQPPEAVWEALADYDANPVTGSMRRESIPLPDEAAGPAWREDIGNTVITVRTVESAKPERLVRTFEDSVVPATSRIEYRLEPDADGTKITLNSTTTVRDGTWHVPFFRVILHLAPDAANQQFLNDLRASLKRAGTNESDDGELS